MFTRQRIGLITVVSFATIAAIALNSRPVAADSLNSSRTEDSISIEKKVTDLEKRITKLEGLLKTSGQLVPGQWAFGDIVCNLKEDRSSRYIRMNLVVTFDEKHSQMMSERLTSQKSSLKTWLLSYLADKTIDSVRGKANMDLIRSEIASEVKKQLSTADEKTAFKDVLFVEFIVQ